VIFIDTSVVVAILSEEDDARLWSERIRDSKPRFTSALVMVEASMRLCTKLGLEPSRIEDITGVFLKDGQIEITPIIAEDAALAIDAFARYGKGRGHPAQLNLADCLSYACAKRLKAKLLYKGDDFARTDIG
jgi:ribonuclease VapC